MQRPGAQQRLRRRRGGRVPQPGPEGRRLDRGVGKQHRYYGNYTGQCNVPAPNSGFVAVAAGYSHSLGLKADGSIVAWGDNANGQCNVPAPNSGFVAVAARGYWTQPGPEGRRLDRGVGRQQLRPMQRPGAQQRLRRRRGGRDPQPGPEGRRLDRGVGKPLTISKSRRPTVASSRSRLPGTTAWA